MAKEFETEQARVHQLALETMEKAMIMIEADTKQLCPVDTGHLKRSYTHDVEDNEGEIVGAVGTNVEYAYWADQHTPHLTQAVDSNMANIQRMFKEELGKGK